MIQSSKISVHVQDVLASEQLTQIVTVSVLGELAEKGADKAELTKFLTGATKNHKAVFAQKFKEHTAQLSDVYAQFGATLAQA